MNNHIMRYLVYKPNQAISFAFDDIELDKD